MGMGIFGTPNIEKLKAMKNFKGLIAALKSKDYHIKEKAIAALVDIGRPAVEPLAQALKDKNVQYKAAEALGKIGGENVLEALNEALNDKEFEVRSEASKALSSLNKPLKGDV